MNKVFICIITLVSGFSIADAQTVQGKVVGKNQEPVEYATIVLQTPDSVYVNSTYTDSEGKFTLSAEMPAFRLIVQHVQYEMYEKYYSDEYEFIIELTEKENTLGEIIVKGERPVVKLVDGKITYDMPLLLSGKAVSNAYESMLQLPGVREQNGSLVLAGASSVTVIINGQVTSMPYENLMAALKMYPADRIQSAEIMYSAPPQYHIRGAAINLVLKGENSGGGLQGQINTAYTQKQYANYTTGVSLTLPANKWTADLNYAYDRSQSKSGVDMYSNHLYNGIVSNIEQFNRGNRKSNDHHIRLGVDYKLTE
ncbi:MAG: carboxypeptidase-like regulatory domain-containing protein, partial [Tannerellaceae bacterium]|nr:carboxypeptidase-like regulatory domain-containing protein [Tannerellaceae bacterium]